MDRVQLQIERSGGYGIVLYRGESILPMDWYQHKIRALDKARAVAKDLQLPLFEQVPLD